MTALSTMKQLLREMTNGLLAKHLREGANLAVGLIAARCAAIGKPYLKRTL